MEGDSCSLRAGHQRISVSLAKNNNTQEPKHVKKRGEKQQRDKSWVLQQPDLCCSLQLNGNIMNIWNCRVIIW